MPMPTQDATAIQEPAGPMLGVNLREDRVLLGPTDLAKSINADLNLAPGSLTVRKGRTHLNTVPLADLKIRRQTFVNGHRYEIAGESIYRDFVLIANGVLSSNLSTNMQGYQPQADTQLWTFIADDNVMLKDNGTSLVPWTIAKPITAPVVAVGAAGGLTGAYFLLYTYVRKTAAGALAAESLPGPASLVVNPATQVINVTGLVPSGDSQVTHLRLYRTLAGGSLYQVDQDIPNGTTTATSTLADSSLGAALSLTNNTPAPLASVVALWNETFWLTKDVLNPTYLWFSQRFNPESVPPANFLSIGDASDPLQYAVPFGGLLGVFSKNKKYRILGNAVSGYHAEEAFSPRGTAAFTATVATEYGVIFVSFDGVWRTDFASPDVQLSQAIYPLFQGSTINDLAPINWAAASTFRAAFWKNRYYLSYCSGSHTAPDMVAVYSFDTKQWYFYDHAMSGLYTEAINDQLLGGGQDGFVSVLESGTDDAGTPITLTCETRDFSGQDKNTRKLYQFVRIDADTKGDQLVWELVIDDVVTTVGTFVSNGRNNQLFSIQQASMGYHWRVVFSYVGSKAVRIFPPAAVYVPLVWS